MLSFSRFCFIPLLLFAFVAGPLPTSGLTTAWTEDNSYNNDARKKYFLRKKSAAQAVTVLSFHALQEAEKSQDSPQYELKDSYAQEIDALAGDAKVSSVADNFQATGNQRMLQQMSNSVSISRDTGTKRPMNMKRRMNMTKRSRNGRDTRILEQNSNSNDSSDDGASGNIRGENSEDRRILQNRSTSNDNSIDGISANSIASDDTGNMRRMSMMRPMTTRNRNNGRKLQQNSISISNDISNDGVSRDSNDGISANSLASNDNSEDNGTAKSLAEKRAQTRAQKRNRRKKNRGKKSKKKATNRAGLSSTSNSASANGQFVNGTNTSVDDIEDSSVEDNYASADGADGSSVEDDNLATGDSEDRRKLQQGSNSIDNSNDGASDDGFDTSKDGFLEDDYESADETEHSTVDHNSASFEGIGEIKVSSVEGTNPIMENGEDRLFI